MKLHANYYKATDGEQLFFATNFTKKDGPSKHPVVLFNYGLACSNLHWKYQLEWFHERGYHFIIHDYRGHFQSSGGDKLESITFKQIAQDAATLVEYLECGPVMVIGHSMGVNVTLEMARLFPHLVKAMCLINGTILPVRGVMFDSNLMEFVTPLLEKGLKDYRGWIEKFWESQGRNPLAVKIIHTQGFNTETVDAQFVEIYLNRVAQLGPDLFLQLFREMQSHDIISALSQIHTPTLVIGGDQDKVIPFHMQHLLYHELPNAQMYVVKDGSHVPQVDFPEMLNERMNLFISQQL